MSLAKGEKTNNLWKSMGTLPPLLPSRKGPSSTVSGVMEKKATSKSVPQPVQKKSQQQQSQKFSPVKAKQEQKNMQVFEFIYSKAVERALRNYGFWSSKPQSCNVKPRVDAEVPKLPHIHEELVFMRQLQAQMQLTRPLDVQSELRVISRPGTNMSHITRVSRVVITRQAQRISMPTRLPAIGLDPHEDSLSENSIGELAEVETRSFVTESIPKDEEELLADEKCKTKKNKNTKKDKNKPKETKQEKGKKRSRDKSGTHT